MKYCKSAMQLVFSLLIIILGMALTERHMSAINDCFMGGYLTALAVLYYQKVSDKL